MNFLQCLISMILSKDTLWITTLIMVENGPISLARLQSKNKDLVGKLRNKFLKPLSWWIKISDMCVFYLLIFSHSISFWKRRKLLLKITIIRLFFLLINAMNELSCKDEHFNKLNKRYKLGLLFIRTENTLP